MSNYRRAITTGATYFFTVVTHHRRPILCNEDVRASLREAIQTVRIEHPFAIEGWVLLPDHLHCIWTLPEMDADFSKRWALIKRYVSKRLQLRYHRSDWMTASKLKRHESTLWQRRFWEHKIRDLEDFNHHLDYLHYNPVKHGHVARVSDWPYSSFHRFVREGYYPEGWGDKFVPSIEMPAAGEYE